MQESVYNALKIVPNHVAIIMDGNGRWAKLRNQPRTNGHLEGLKRAKEITKAASEFGIKHLTLYVFSTENWKRTQQEVGFLMNLIHSHLIQELDFYRENQIKVKLLGDKTGLPQNIQKDIDECENDTKDFNGLTIHLAINYGGRNELVRSVKNIIKSANNKEIDVNSVSEDLINMNFDDNQLPDVDYIIRTGGEKRLSNFLLWQSAYAELQFNDILWPEYTKDKFYEDLLEFENRNRRFGAVPV